MQPAADDSRRRQPPAPLSVSGTVRGRKPEAATFGRSLDQTRVCQLRLRHWSRQRSRRHLLFFLISSSPPSASPPLCPCRHRPRHRHCPRPRYRPCHCCHPIAATAYTVSITSVPASINLITTRISTTTAISQPADDDTADDDSRRHRGPRDMITGCRHVLSIASADVMSRQRC